MVVAGLVEAGPVGLRELGERSWIRTTRRCNTHQRLPIIQVSDPNLHLRTCAYGSILTFAVVSVWLITVNLDPNLIMTSLKSRFRTGVLAAAVFFAPFNANALVDSAIMGEIVKAQIIIGQIQ